MPFGLDMKLVFVRLMSPVKRKKKKKEKMRKGKRRERKEREKLFLQWRD